MPNHAGARAPQIADLLSPGFMQFPYFTPSHFTNVQRTLAGPTGQIRKQGEIMWLARVRTRIAACVVISKTDEEVGTGRIHLCTLVS